MDFSSLVEVIRDISMSAQTAAARTVDHLATLRNWLIGAWIVEYEQNGEDRAAYGAKLLDRLADRLTRARVSGMSARNLKNFRQVPTRDAAPVAGAGTAVDFWVDML